MKGLTQKFLESNQIIVGKKSTKKRISTHLKRFSSKGLLFFIEYSSSKNLSFFGIARSPSSSSIPKMAATAAGLSVDVSACASIVLRDAAVRRSNHCSDILSHQKVYAGISHQGLSKGTSAVS